MSKRDWYIVDWCQEQLMRGVRPNLPVVMVGDTRSLKYEAVLKLLGWGRIIIERRVNLYEGEPWGFDNGAYIDWQRGRSLPSPRGKTNE